MGVTARNILLAGATGLVGSMTLRGLLADTCRVGAVFAPSRRALAVSDPRLVVPIVDFAAATSDAAIAAAIEGHPHGRLDAYLCCLGTTIGTAGSREAFIAVDRELVLRLAQIAYDLGARHAILVSSVGASRQSGNFYLRIKGEVEDALERIGFTRLDIMQPGLLLGARGERRPGEALAQKLAPLANPLFLGKLRRYRGIEADCLATAIVRLLEHPQPGQYSHQYDAIQALAAEG